MENQNEQYWRALLGPAYSLAGASRLLGVSAEETTALANSQELWSLETADGNLIFPAIQFTPEGTVLPGLKELLTAYPPEHSNSWGTALWLLQPHPDLGNRSPLSWLQEQPKDTHTPAQRLAHERAHQLNQ